MASFSAICAARSLFRYADFSFCSSSRSSRLREGKKKDKAYHIVSSPVPKGKRHSQGGKQQQAAGGSTCSPALAASSSHRSASRASAAPAPPPAAPPAAAAAPSAASAPLPARNEDGIPGSPHGSARPRTAPPAVLTVRTASSSRRSRSTAARSLAARSSPPRSSAAGGSPAPCHADACGRQESGGAPGRPAGPRLRHPARSPCLLQSARRVATATAECGGGSERRLPVSEGDGAM